MEQENLSNNTAEVEIYDTPVPETTVCPESADAAVAEKRQKLLNSFSAVMPWGLVLLLILQPLSPLILALTLLIAGLGLGGLFRIFPLWKVIPGGILLIAAGFALVFLPDLAELFFHIAIGALFLGKGILLFREAKDAVHAKYILCVGIISCIAGFFWAAAPLVAGAVLPVFSVFLLFSAALQLLAVNLLPETKRQ